MKNAVICLLALAAAFLLGSPRKAVNAAPVTQNGITLELLSPIAGSTVSNTITLSANASSLAGPITKVEFYVDGVLVGISTNKFAKPGDLTVY